MAAFCCIRLLDAMTANIGAKIACFVRIFMKLEPVSEPRMRTEDENYM